MELDANDAFEIQDFSVATGFERCACQKATVLC